MSAMIGGIVPGSCLIMHVGIGSKQHVLLDDFPIIFYNVTGLNWFERSK